MAKKDPIKQLIDDATDLVTKNKGIVMGVVIGYLVSNVLEKKPEIRNALLGALTGSSDVKKLAESFKHEDDKD